MTPLRQVPSKLPLQVGRPEGARGSTERKSNAARGVCDEAGDSRPQSTGGGKGEGEGGVGVQLTGLEWRAREQRIESRPRESTSVGMRRVAATGEAVEAVRVEAATEEKRDGQGRIQGGPSERKVGLSSLDGSSIAVALGCAAHSLAGWHQNQETEADNRR